MRYCKKYKLSWKLLKSKFEAVTNETNENFIIRRILLN